MKIHEVDKNPAKISEIEWRDMIYIINLGSKIRVKEQPYIG